MFSQVSMDDFDLCFPLTAVGHSNLVGKWCLVNSSQSEFEGKKDKNWLFVTSEEIS